MTPIDLDRWLLEVSIGLGLLLVAGGLAAWQLLPWRRWFPKRFDPTKPVREMYSDTVYLRYPDGQLRKVAGTSRKARRRKR